MKSISIDFKNNRVCIMTEGQQGTEYNPDLVKDTFLDFIPVKYRNKNSFTWNFDNETFVVNKNFSLIDGCVMTSDDFIPSIIIPMNGLKKRYKDFISLMHYEEVNLKEEISSDPFLRNLLGLE